MKLSSELEKDAKQFLREKRTPLLLVAGPLLVLVIMGAIFSADDTLIGKSVMGICDLDGSKSSTFFLSGINSSSELIEYGGGKDCIAAMEKDVRTGKLAAGIVIPEGFEKGMESGDTQNISMLLDNSRFQVSPSIEAFVKANVQETNGRIGAQFILSVWKKLDEANMNLNGIFSDINETRARATQMKSELNKTAESLNSLDIGGVRKEILVANGTVAQTSAALDNAERNITRIESDFAGYEDDLKQTEGDLLLINGTLANASSYIRQARSVANCSSIIFIPYCASLDSLNATVENAHNAVEQRIAKVKKAEQGLAAANLTIQEFKANIAAARVGINESKKSIDNMQGFVDELDRNKAESLQTLVEVDRSVDEILAKTYELEEIIKQSRSQISGITARSPEFIISPMVVAPDHLFGNRPFFEFMLPSVLPLILMFVSLFLASTSLVKEEYNGTLARVYTSQVNRFKYAGVKVLSYSIVLMPCAVLLALVASIAYNAFPVSDWTTWFYVLQALYLLILAFVSLGVLIAIYSKSEATAFLASLVVGLPLLFLSGLLFPFEFMPQLISALGQMSPLTQAVVSMQTTLLYDSPQFVSSLVLLFYAVVFAALAGLSLKK